MAVGLCRAVLYGCFVGSKLLAIGSFASGLLAKALTCSRLAFILGSYALGMCSIAMRKARLSLLKERKARLLVDKVIILFNGAMDLAHKSRNLARVAFDRYTVCANSMVGTLRCALMSSRLVLNMSSFHPLYDMVVRTPVKRMRSSDLRKDASRCSEKSMLANFESLGCSSCPVA